MPQITRSLSLPFLLLVLLLVVSGCGDANPDATFDPQGAEGHPSNWLPEGHSDKASANLASCTECHGVSFDGGISKVACVSCHLGSETEVHPLDWDGFAYSRHKAYVETNGNTSCSVEACHGAELSGVSNSGPSCVSACHLGGIESIHPVEWGDLAYARHGGYVEDNGNGSCSNQACHGPDLAGVEESGPSCTSCHMGGLEAVHPASWTELDDHGEYVFVNGGSECGIAACHGTSLEGVLLSGPSCFVCH